MRTRPLSAEERTLWRVERDLPGTAANTIAAAFPLPAPPDREALRQSLTILVGQLPALRTVVRGDPPTASTAPVEVDLPTLDEDFATRPFDLERGPLVRFALDGNRFAVAAHHLVFDTVSSANLLRALDPVHSAVLRGAPPPQVAVPAPPPRPADPTTHSTLLHDLAPTGLPLSTDHPDPPRPTLAAAHVEHELSPEAWEAVARMRRTMRAPEAVVLLAAYQALLAARGGGPLVGTPVDRRGRDHTGAIGYHVALAPVRSDVDPGAPFAELVLACRESFFAALTAATPVDAALPDPVEGTWRALPLRHVFNYVPATAPPLFQGAEVEVLPLEPGASRHDLELRVLAGPTPRLLFHHRTEISTRAQVRALAVEYDAFLVAAERADSLAAALR